MRTDIRFAIPSNGRLETDALAFLKACGLDVQRANPRQYTAIMPALPGVTAVWQRQNDIVRGIRLGSLDFAIVGQDTLEERCEGETGCEEVIVLHDELDVSHCELHLAVPLAWDTVNSVADLAGQARNMLAREGRPLRVATKYPNVTRKFLEQYDIPHELVRSDGTLEIAPAIGYADMIADLVSTGTTLRDNQLKVLDDGLLVHSQAILVGNRTALRQRPDVLAVARELLEYFEAHLRAQGCYTVTANVRGDSPQAIARLMLDHPHIRGLQGPTISPVVPHNGTTQSMVNWYAINIIVQRTSLAQAIRELRAIGGSGVIVTEVKYIFEEEPARYRKMLETINN